MSSLYTATCPKCQCRFCWFGTLRSKPMCPKCKHLDDDEAETLRVEELEAKLEAQMLAEFDNDR